MIQFQDNQQFTTINNQNNFNTQNQKNVKPVQCQILQDLINDCISNKNDQKKEKEIIQNIVYILNSKEFNQYKVSIKIKNICVYCMKPALKQFYKHNCGAIYHTEKINNGNEIVYSCLENICLDSENRCIQCNQIILKEDLKKHNVDQALIDKQIFIPYKKYKCHYTKTSFCEVEDFKENLIDIGECNHLYCLECFQSYVNFMSEKNPDSLVFDCPKGHDNEGKEITCNEKINVPVIEHNCKEIYNKIQERLANKNFTNAQCPKCHTPFYVPNKNRNFNCINDSCGIKICFSCGQQDHGSSKCSNDELKKQLFAWQEDPKDHEEGKEFRIRFCPNEECLIPCAKDPSCEHVKCQRCQTEFCFDCSCFRQPTQVHDFGKYHRLGCFIRKAQQIENINNPDFVKYDEKCNQCIKTEQNQKPCEYPVPYNDFIEKVCQKYEIGEDTYEDLTIRIKICKDNEKYKEKLKILLENQE